MVVGYVHACTLMPARITVAQLPAMFAKMDSDGSGAISLDEFIDCLAELFMQVHARLDAP